MKKRIGTFLLVMLMCVTTTSVFAENKTSMGGLQKNISNNKNIFKSTLTTVDGQEVRIPDASEFENANKKISKKARALSEDEYAETKAVAEEKASILLNSKYESTSVQYALIDNGKIVVSGNSGVYSKEDNKPVTADTMYGIGSVSKMFVTTAVMKLVDKGLVDLDAPVTKYISDFEMADDRYKKITVRMLLNHSSGLMGSTFSNAMLFNDNDPYAHDNFLNQLKTQRLKADPGAYSVYCNDGFTLAEILVERVTGNSYTNYIANNITNPLKMDNTKTPASNFDRNKLAKIYSSGSSSALPVENLNVFGAGGHYSSAEDLCLFGTTFTNNSNGILSKESLKAMENKEYLNGIWPEDGDNTINYGLGWDSVNMYPFNKYNIKALTKGGDSHFYHCNLTVLPEKNMAIAVVSSGGSSMYNQVMAQEVLLAALKEKGEIKEILPDKTFSAPEKIDVPSELKKYEGTYSSPRYGFIDVKIDKSGILNLSIAQYPQLGSVNYYYTKDGKFVSSDGIVSLKFVEESNGKTYIQQEEYVNMPMIGQTYMNQYAAQKEEIVKLEENLSKAWEKRIGKKYYLVNEKYSSEVYMLMYPMIEVNFAKGFEGYLGLNKIVDENSATAILDGPGMMSRDQSDYKFYNKGKYEYLDYSSFTWVEEAAIATLPTKNKFTTTINEDGYANWYKIGDESAGKEITVDIPENAAFVVYDSNGVLLNNSLITGNKSVKLPKDGTIAFLANPFNTFTIEYKK